MNKPDEDALSKLWDITGLQDARQKLADTVFPWARVDPETNQIVFTSKGEKLIVKEKLLILLLARKAMSMRGVISKESIAPIEIARMTGIGGGTLRPILKQLYDEKLVQKDPNQPGHYFVHNSRIGDIHEMFAKKEDMG